MAETIRKMKPRKTHESGAGRTILLVGMVMVICVALVLGIIFATGGSEKGTKRLSAQTTPTTPTTPGSTATTAAPTSTSGVDVSKVEVPPLAIYRRRNPFKPLVNMESPTTPAGTGAGIVTVPPNLTSGASNAGDVVSRAVTLEGTYDQDGQQYARIRIGDQLFDKVAVGSTFANSYKLLSISKDTSATILYGDERVTVYTGQSIYW